MVLCIFVKKNNMWNKLDLESFIGNKYNRLTIIRVAENHITSGGNSKRRITCKCDCGITKDYDAQSVLHNITKSCGCYSRENASKRMKTFTKTHGYYGIPEYNVWRSMKKRCFLKTHKSYKDYGNRGITVCDEWINDFGKFLEDVGFRPNKSMSLDRINNNNGYSKENCRWATTKQQMQNQRSTIFAEYNNKKECLSELAIILNIKYGFLHYHFKEKNKTIKEIIELYEKRI